MLSLAVKIFCLDIYYFKKEYFTVKLEDAVIVRIEQLCIEHNMTKYQLFKASGVPQSTLTSIKKKRSGSVRLITLYSICEGFGMSLEDFFRSPLFAREELSD